MPLLRKLYNGLYQYFISDIEKQWELAVQRKTAEGEAVPPGDAEADVVNIAGLEVELDIDLHIIGGEVDHAADEIGDHRHDQQGAHDGHDDDESASEDDWEDEDDEGHDPNTQQAAAEPRHNQRRAARQNQPAANDANENPQVAANDPAAIPAAAGDLFGNPRPASIPIRSPITLVTGALFFPALSSLAGDLLYYLLPSALTIAKPLSRTMFWQRSTASSSAHKFLQERWARTVLGGCLLVLGRDAVVLYCKWRRASDWGERHVQDYTGPAGPHGTLASST